LIGKDFAILGQNTTTALCDMGWGPLMRSDLVDVTLVSAFLQVSKIARY
jgi:hypothetical protein